MSLDSGLEPKALDLENSGNFVSGPNDRLFGRFRAIKPPCPLRTVRLYSLFGIGIANPESKIRLRHRPNYRSSGDCYWLWPARPTARRACDHPSDHAFAHGCTKIGTRAEHSPVVPDFRRHGTIETPNVTVDPV